MPLLDLFVDSIDFRFHHGDPCALDVVAELPAAAAGASGTLGGGAATLAAASSASSADGSSTFLTALPPPVLAGTPLEVTVRCVDAFGNPCTDAQWWTVSKWQVAAQLEEIALPKEEAHTLETASVLAGHHPSMPGGGGTGGGGGGGKGSGGGGGGKKGEGGVVVRAPSRLPSGSKPHTVAETPSGEFKKVSTLKLVNGEAKAKVLATVAGELRLLATHVYGGGGASGGKGGGKPAGGAAGAFDRELAVGMSQLSIKAGKAEHFDLVPLDQGGHAMRVMVHARDAYGNLDEECEKEVVLQLGGGGGGDEAGGGGHEGAAAFPRVMMPDRADGVVKLTHGVAEVSTIGVNSPEEYRQLLTTPRIAVADRGAAGDAGGAGGVGNEVGTQAG